MPCNAPNGLAMGFAPPMQCGGTGWRTPCLSGQERALPQAPARHLDAPWWPFAPLAWMGYGCTNVPMSGNVAIVGVSRSPAISELGFQLLVHATSCHVMPRTKDHVPHPTSPVPSTIAPSPRFLSLTPPAPRTKRPQHPLWEP